jgi:hypothetical protein
VPLPANTSRAESDLGSPQASCETQLWTGVDWRLRVCLAAAALLIVWLWVLPMVNSFWLDETLVAVLIKGTLAQALRNTAQWPHSILFSAVEWTVSHISRSSSEIALRLPSLCAALATLYVWYRVGLEYFDSECGLIFAALYAILPQVSRQVPSARPYALGLLAETAALLFLLRWLKARQTSSAYLWSICSAIAVHLHIVFALSFGIELLFLLALCLYKRRLNSWVLFGSATVSVALMAFVVPQAMMEFRERYLLEIPLQAPGWGDLLKAAVPIAFIPIAVVGVVFLVARVSHERGNWNEAFLVGLVLMVIPFGLFALAYLGAASVFVPRYLLPAIPGVIMVWGVIVWSLKPRWVRGLSLACSVLLAAGIAARGGPIPQHQDEDWRAAVSAVKNTGQLIVYPGLVETRRLEWLDAAERWPFLIAPALTYRPDLSPKNSLILPFAFGPEEKADVKRRLGTRLEGQESVAIIARGMFAAEDWISWFSAQARAQGFQRIYASRFGIVDVVVFHKV